MRPFRTSVILLALAALSSCIQRPVPAPTPAAPTPPPLVFSYFRSHYRSPFHSWRVLGPFPSPRDALTRDLLLASGGEARVRPGLRAVIVPPQRKERWRRVSALDHDEWSFPPLRTRYKGYVPLYEGPPREGAETAIAFASAYFEGGPARVLLTVWGAGRLLVNGKPVIGPFRSPDFFGQKEAFVDLRSGENVFLVKIENAQYNRTANAEEIFGSWGFYLDVWPAGEPAAGLHLDLPFRSDFVPGDERIVGTVAVRGNGGATLSDLFVTLKFGSTSSTIPLEAPPRNGAAFTSFLLPVSREAGGANALLFEHSGRTILKEPLEPLPKRGAILRRAVISSVDETAQPYLVAAPAAAAAPIPFLYLHGGVTTEEELVNWAGAVAEEGLRKGFLICAPRAREGAVLSGAAEEDILLSLKETEIEFTKTRKKAVVFGSGTGALAALRLASHFPHLFRGVIALMWNPFEKSVRAEPDYSVVNRMVSNLGPVPVVVLSEEGDAAAGALRARLEAAGVKTIHDYVPFEAKPLSEETAQRLIRHAASFPEPVSPRSFSFETTRSRWRRAWWVEIGSIGSRARAARVEARMDKTSVEIRTQNISGLLLFPDLMPEGKEKITEIKWNGKKVFSGPIASEPLVRLSGGSEGQPYRPEGPLDELLREPHLFVVPAIPALKKSAEILLRKSTVRARFGRNAGMWKTRIRIVDPKSEIRLPERERDKHLILFGTPSENPFLSRISKKLPFVFTDEEFAAAGRSFPLRNHVVLAVGPNPEAADRLVCLFAGRPLEQFARAAASSTLNPFAHPETLHDIVVWKFREETESFEKVFEAVWEGRRITPVVERK